MNRADLSDTIWVFLDKTKESEREIWKASFFVAEWDSAGTGARSAAAARGLGWSGTRGPAMRKQGF